jgi:voltage-gated potassium channel
MSTGSTALSATRRSVMAMDDVNEMHQGNGAMGRLERHRDRFGRLLAVLVSAFLLTGLSDRPGMRVLVAAAQFVAIAVAVGTTGLPSRFPRGPSIAALVLVGVAAVVLSGFGSGYVEGWGFVCSAFVTGGLLIIVLNRILNHHDVQLQTLAGAMCAYLLFGSFFGSIFAAMDLLGPSRVFNHLMTQPDYGYFSVATLTTVGYGDIVAVGEFARRLAMVEAITGQMFLATAVARLMSVARISRRGDQAGLEPS